MECLHGVVFPSTKSQLKELKYNDGTYKRRRLSWNRKGKTSG